MIACDPNQTVDVCLPDDAEQPPETRPTFRYRHMTAREVLQREQMFDAASQLGTDAERVPAFIDAISVGLVGWRNVVDPDGNPIPFGTADLARALTPIEMGELFSEAGTATRLSEVQKKTSRSRAPSAPANSAPTAAPAASA